MGSPSSTHATCDRCGRTRVQTDMARTYEGGVDAWWCHPAMGESPTCYDEHVGIDATGVLADIAAYYRDPHGRD